MTVEFIADVGTAWMGDFDLLDYMVEKLKRYGVTAFKPQVWPKSIYKGHELEQEALTCLIDNNNIKNIEKISERHGLEAFYSVFDENCLKRVLLNTKAKRVKFAHSMRSEGKLIAMAVESPQIEQVIISVIDFADAERTAEKEVNKYFKIPWPKVIVGKIRLLYCVPNYPTTVDEVHFTDDSRLHGFSDHTTGLLAPVVAVARKAQMIEKHVMCNEDEYLRYLGYVPNFPDRVCSISLDKFGLMVSDCSAAERMIS